MLITLQIPYTFVTCGAVHTNKLTKMVAQRDPVAGEIQHATPLDTAQRPVQLYSLLLRVCNYDHSDLFITKQTFESDSQSDSATQLLLLVNEGSH